MKVALLVLLSLLCVPRSEADEAITPERAEALLAWVDRAPLPGLHGADFVRVWTGESRRNIHNQWEPEQYLAFLLEDGPTSFQILTPDSQYLTLNKRGAEPATQGFVGFRKASVLGEAREFLAQLNSPLYSDDVRNRWFSQTFVSFCTPGTKLELENLIIAYWSARQGDKKLAVALLNTRHTWQIGIDSHRGDSLEIELQKVTSVILRTNAYSAFGDKNALRPDLLANFQKIAALCPNTDLSDDREPTRILERMVRDDAAHRTLTDEQFSALPPAARAEELVFRLRDERLSMFGLPENPNIREAWPDNGSLSALENLGLAAAPALVKALDDDSFTRVDARRFPPIFRVRDLALEALKVISGFSFSDSAKANEPAQSGFDAARLWWKGMSENKSEKDYLMERVAANDPHLVEFVHQLLKKYGDQGVPFLIEQIPANPDLDARVFLARVLWKRADPRCVEFFARQALEGREIGDRVAAAYGLRYQHDGRAISAMCAEWSKLVAANGASKWPELEDNITNFNNPWSVAKFLAASNAPEASLCLGEHAESLPVEWRAKIILRLAAFSRREVDEIGDRPTAGAKKAIEDALHGFLTDPAEYAPEPDYGADLIGGGRICDLAARLLSELFPEKYNFDRWLSPAARTRQCLIAVNVRARELGEPLSPLPPETAKKTASEKSWPVVSEVSISAPFADTSMGVKIAALRGLPLNKNALVFALLSYFTQPGKSLPGFSLSVARYHDAPGISIHLIAMPGPNLGRSACFGSFRYEDDGRGLASNHSQMNFQNWSDPKSWVPLEDALKSVAASPPRSAFAIGVRITSAPPSVRPILVL